MPFMQKQIIPYFPQEINPFFKNNSGNPQEKSASARMLSRGRNKQISSLWKIR
jgi:hypothetical protein